MTRRDLLENALHRITQRAGLDGAGAFHVTQVSRDTGGLYILEVLPPRGHGVCNAVGREVSGFPAEVHGSCVPLLPDVVDGIIAAAQPPLCSRRT